MSIKLEMLRVFRVVAEQGTLAASARSLGRTPSAISMTLAQLEDDIGAPLFETDRKSRLTPLGRLVLEESRRAVGPLDPPSPPPQAIRPVVAAASISVCRIFFDGFIFFYLVWCGVRYAISPDIDTKQPPRPQSPNLGGFYISY